jgi:divalent metal cation (Fe/Co/Zn/Cd) transporter
MQYNMTNAKASHTPAQLRAMLYRGLLLEYASVGWMTIESIVSLSAGILAGSLSLVAFGGDSLVELVSAVSVATYLIRERAGRSNPSSLEKTERVTGLLLFLLIPTIGLGAIYSVLAGTKAEASPLGIVVALGAVAIMPVLWIQKRKIGREANCKPLSNDAVESATCFFMSVTLLAGLLAVSFFGLWWVDYVATAIILGFVGHEAMESQQGSE